ncbi:MAG: hypothetical protein ACK41T_10315 [Pseudobdellovibrio sp.]
MLDNQPQPLFIQVESEVYSVAKFAVLSKNPIGTEIDVFSNKSSIVLFWLLMNHKRIKEDGFSINELKRITGLSIGLVHKVVQQLEYTGIVVAKGLRTNKKFYLKAADKILLEWVKKYNLIKKTKTKGYSFTHFINKELDYDKLRLIPALHTSASKLFKIKSTNIRSTEYYLTNWNDLKHVEHDLKLEELDRGYELLLIKPYYSE